MKHYEIETYDTAWCPGCGNFTILEALKETLVELDKKPYEVLVAGGIGQAPKTAQYISVNGFCGLHGRALPPAAGAKIANDNLTVIVNTGDGDSYGEGGNHFMHNIRRNVDITHFVHDNQIYGLTKGQASPTTTAGQITEVQPLGSLSTPVNPILLAISLGAGFVARGFSGDKEHLKSLMKQAIQHRGYALVDILQPCVTFNKVNTFQWYSKRIYKLDETYDRGDKALAIQKAMEWEDKIPLGVLYEEQKPDYTSQLHFLKDGPTLVDRQSDLSKVESYLREFQ